MKLKFMVCKAWQSFIMGLLLKVESDPLKVATLDAFSFKEVFNVLLKQA